MKSTFTICPDAIHTGPQSIEQKEATNELFDSDDKYFVFQLSNMDDKTFCLTSDHTFLTFS